MTKPIVYIDMDGVIADFSKAIKTHPMSSSESYQKDPDNIPGIFEHLELVPGAKEAIYKIHLSNKYEPPWGRHPKYGPIPFSHFLNVEPFLRDYSRGLDSGLPNIDDYYEGLNRL